MKNEDLATIVASLRHTSPEFKHPIVQAIVEEIRQSWTSLDEPLRRIIRTVFEVEDGQVINWH